MEEFQVEDEGEIQHLDTNKYIPLVILVLSPQVTYIVHRYLLSTYMQLWNRDSLGYGMESGWCTLHCMQALFRTVTITGVVVRGFRSSSVPVTHEGYLVESRRPLWFGPHKPIALSLTALSRHSPLATASRSTSIISLCFGSSARGGPRS